MEKLSILLIALFLILCIGQLYYVEPFAEADIKNATVTMSLSDILYYSGSASKGVPVPRPEYGQYGQYGHSSDHGSDLGSYLYLKNEMTRQFKEHLNTRADSSLQPMNIEPPSCAQGSSYMETVPLKVPASCSQ